MSTRQEVCLRSNQFFVWVHSVWKLGGWGGWSEPQMLLKDEKLFASMQIKAVVLQKLRAVLQMLQPADFQRFHRFTTGYEITTLGISNVCPLKLPCTESCGFFQGPIRREIMELSVSDSQPCSSKWDELQSKRSGHCCTIDYQCKMSDSLSQALVFHPAIHVQSHRWIQLFCLLSFVTGCILYIWHRFSQ